MPRRYSADGFFEGSSVTMKIRRRVRRLRLADVVEPLGERDLGVVVDVELAEDEDAVFLKRLHDRGRQALVLEELLAPDAERPRPQRCRRGASW